MARKIDDFLAVPSSRGARAPSGPRHSDLEKLQKELEDLRESIEELRSEVSECKRLIREALEKLSRQNTGLPPQRRRGTWSLRRILKEARFVMASEAKARLGLSPQKLRSEAIAEGLVVLEAGGDFAVMTRDSLEEFKSLLASLNTADPAEAARELGEYGRLFQALRDGGQVYYDARRRRWVVLWE